MSDDQTYNVYEKSAVVFEKLSAKSGDLITITVPANMNPQQMKAFSLLIQESIADYLPEGVNAVIVASNIQVEHWPKEMMARHGWYKLS